MHDFDHLEVSEAARAQNAADGRGPVESSSSRRFPLADQRGQVNLWAGKKSTSLSKDRQALPLNFHNNRRLRQGVIYTESKGFEQCGSRQASAPRLCDVDEPLPRHGRTMPCYHRDDWRPDPWPPRWQVLL